MNLKCSVFLLIVLLSGTKFERAKAVEKCVSCKSGDPLDCEATNSEVECSVDETKILLNKLGKYFSNLPHIKSNTSRYNCFLMDLVMDRNENSKSFTRIKSCVPTEIGICDLIPKKESKWQKKACMQCDHDQCNGSYEKALHLQAEDKERKESKDKSYKDDGDHDHFSTIETHSIVFCIIVFLALIVCSAAFVLAKKYLLQPVK